MSLKRKFLKFSKKKFFAQLEASESGNLCLDILRIFPPLTTFTINLSTAERSYDLGCWRRIFLKDFLEKKLTRMRHETRNLN